MGSGNGFVGGEVIQQSLLSARGDVSRRPVADRLVPLLLAALAGRGWVASAVLVRELGVSKRELREAANRSGGHVLGGQAGYCVTLEASVQDVVAVVNRHYSQARAA